MDKQIDQLYDVLMKIESEQNNKDLYAWLTQVCQKQFGLVDGLVANFIENIDDPNFARKLLKVLKKLNESLPDIVLEQFLNNQKFPGAIVKYLESTEIKDMAGDGFILLINVFSDSTVEFVSEKFISQLISSMDYIADEHTLNALISILIMLCSAIEKRAKKEGKVDYTNPVLEEFVSNDHYYREKLLYLTNRGNAYRFDKCLETINIMLQKEDTHEFFNINDMNLIMDICLREIQRQNQQNTRVQILQAIETIVDNKKYQNYPYKLDDIRQTVNELILFEDEEAVGGGYSIKEKECIARLNLKMQIMNFNN